jgi:RND family efflux transporter MFP subunit
MKARVMEPKQRYSFKWVIAGFIVMGFGLLAMFGAGGINSVDSAGESVSTSSLPVVEVAQVVEGASEYTLEIPGRLRARNGISLVGEVAGKIVFVDPRLVLGGRFVKDEILIEINKNDYSAEVARAEAVLASSKAILAQTKADTKRRIELFDTGAVTEVVRDQAIANLASAEASLQQAEAQLIVARENLSRATIRAPFPALVLAEGASLGGYVSPGQELAQLMDIRAAELVAGVSPREAAAIVTSMTRNQHEIKVTAKPNEGSVGTKPLTGRIDNFSPAIDSTSRSALIVAVFPDAFSTENTGRVFSGDFMTLEIPVSAGDDNVWRVPYGALRRNEYIWLVNDQGQLEQENVVVLSEVNGSAMISSKSDLSEKRVLLTALSEEREGLKVTPVPLTTNKN